MIQIIPSDDRERAMWLSLIELSAKAADWTLIGARMVELHALERGRVLRRLSLDADALADARARPNAVRRVTEILIAAGFKPDDPSYMGVGHTFVRDGVSIDVLAPDGLGGGERSIAARTTLAPVHTVQVPGGTQALRRSELVEVQVNGTTGKIPRPNLLGAILLKARAVAVDDAPESQRTDLALLLSLVDDPNDLVSELRGEERSWLRRRREMDDPNAACWQTLAPEQQQVALYALRSLAGFEEMLPR